MSTVSDQMPIFPSRMHRIPPMTRFIIGVLGFIMVLTLFAMGSEFLKNPSVFPVSNVDVMGTLDYTDRATLSGVVEEDVSKGLLAMDIDHVREELESLPWVAAAHVRREWPGRLTLAIEEHEPAARWNNDGLVSKSCLLYTSPSPRD